MIVRTSALFTISRRRATTFRKCSPSPVRDTVIDSTATSAYLIRMYRLASHLRNPFSNLRSSGVFGLFYQVHFENYVLPCALNFSTFTSENLNFCGRELHCRVYSLTALEGLPDRIYFAYSSLSLSRSRSNLSLTILTHHLAPLFHDVV